MKTSYLLLEKPLHFCGEVFRSLLMWFSELIILHYLWVPISWWETHRHLWEGSLRRNSKTMKITMLQLEMQLPENYSMPFCTVTEKRNVVLELSGYYHLQFIVAIIQAFSNCFQISRFVVLDVTYCWIISHIGVLGFLCEFFLE